MSTTFLSDDMFNKQDVFVKHTCPQWWPCNSKDGQDYKDKYFDTSKKILTQEMTTYNMEALIFYFVEGMPKCQCQFFLKIGQMSKSKYLSSNRKNLSQGISMWMF